MRIPSPIAAVAATTLAAGLVLAGCGAEDEPGTAAPSTGTSVSTPAPSRTATKPAASPSEPGPAPSRTVTVGELAFTGTKLDGQPFDAASLAGKPVLLWFWAPWCSVCAAEAPDVLDVVQRHGGKVGVLGVAGLDKRKNMQPFVDRTKTGAVTHLADPEGEIWRRFKVSQQSTYVLLDAAGKVTFSGVLSGDDLRAKVAGLAG